MLCSPDAFQAMRKWQWIRVSGCWKALAVCLQTVGGRSDISGIISSFLVTSQSCLALPLVSFTLAAPKSSWRQAQLCASPQTRLKHAAQKEADISCNYSLTDALLGILCDPHWEREAGKSLESELPKHPSELTQAWFGTSSSTTGCWKGNSLDFPPFLFVTREKSLKTRSDLKSVHEPAKPQCWGSSLVWWSSLGASRGQERKGFKIISSARFKVLKALSGISGGKRRLYRVRTASMRYFWDKWMENFFSRVIVLTITTVWARLQAWISHLSLGEVKASSQVGKSHLYA